MTFLKFSLKCREGNPCREAASNALSNHNRIGADAAFDGDGFRQNFLLSKFWIEVGSNDICLCFLLTTMSFPSVTF